MGNLILAGRDPDDVFAYNTAKLVRIRDRYLGLLHYLFQTLIFLYLLWNIYANQLYIDYNNQMVGTMRVRLAHSQRQVIGSQVDVFQSPYCQNLPPHRHCQIWDDHDVIRTMSENSVFLATFVTEQLQERICDRKAQHCSVRPYKSIEEEQFFIAGIEDMVLKVDHTVMVPSQEGSRTLFTSSNRKMTGHLYGPADGISTFARPKLATYLSDDLIADQIPIPLLLQAAGIDLDQVSDFPKNPTNATLREHGTVLHLSVAYSNVRNGRLYVIGVWVSVSNLAAGSTDCYYSYFVHRVPQTKFAFHTTTRMPRGLSSTGAADTSDESESASTTAHLNYTRALTENAGLNILVTQQMSLAVFSAQQLLLQFASGMSLLAISATIVDFVAFNFMPAKKYYYFYKYQLTADFSDLREGKVQLNSREVDDAVALITTGRHRVASPKVEPIPGAAAAAAAAVASPTATATSPTATTTPTSKGRKQKRR